MHVPHIAGHSLVTSKSANKWGLGQNATSSDLQTVGSAFPLHVDAVVVVVTDVTVLVESMHVPHKTLHVARNWSPKIESAHVSNSNALPSAGSGSPLHLMLPLVVVTGMAEVVESHELQRTGHDARALAFKSGFVQTAGSDASHDCGSTTPLHIGTSVSVVVWVMVVAVVTVTVVAVLLVVHESQSAGHRSRATAPSSASLQMPFAS